MITYKNISFSAKTFYGVKFESGEIKAVPGYINCHGMLRIPNDVVIAEKSELSEIKPIIDDNPIPTPTVSRGRRKKSIEPEKVSLAETQENIIISEEETSNGNPS